MGGSRFMRGEVLINEKDKQGLLERKQRLGTATLKELTIKLYLRPSC